jgi:hypothetical protein
MPFFKTINVCVQDPSAEFHLNLGEVVRQVTALYRAADGPTPRIRTLDLQVYVYCFSFPLVSPLFVVAFYNTYLRYGYRRVPSTYVPKLITASI